MNRRSLGRVKMCAMPLVPKYNFEIRTGLLMKIFTIGYKEKFRVVGDKAKYLGQNIS